MSSTEMESATSRSFVGAKSPVRVVTVHHLAADAPDGVVDQPRAKLRALRGEGGIVPLVERLVLKRADHLVAVSSATQTAIIRRFAIPEESITVI